MSLVGQSIGRYHIIEQLGRGGMATVYKAFDTRLERQVAIKVIRQDAVSSEFAGQMLKRFEREAKSLARMSHGNIVKVHDYGEYNGSPYLVMEYVEGGTLSKMTGSPIPVAKAASLLVSVARALDYAHGQKIIHRDVKPANILINEAGQPMLTDFGIAKMLEVDESATSLTGSGLGIGTPEYMSPEQCLGKQVDARSDVYSLGVVFYEMVTGRKPYTADTPMAVVVKHINDALVRPQQIVQTLPDEVEKVIFKALAKDPDERYQDMESFALALERLAQPERESRQVEKSIDTTIQEKSTASLTPSQHVPSAASAVPDLPPAPPPFPSTAGAYGEKTKKDRRGVMAMGVGALGLLAIVCLLLFGVASFFWLGEKETVQATDTVRVVAIADATRTPTEFSSRPVVNTKPSHTPDYPYETEMPETQKPYLAEAEEVRIAVEEGALPYIGDYAIPLEDYSDEEYDLVDTLLSFYLPLSKLDQSYIWKYGWCTSTEEILYENMEHVTIELYINDVLVPDNKIYRTQTPRGGGQDGVCDSLHVLVSDWPQDDTYLLDLLFIEEPINDGWGDYPAGVLMREYQIGPSDSD